jgi:hypothetical protein
MCEIWLITTRHLFYFEALCAHLFFQCHNNTVFHSIYLQVPLFDGCDVTLPRSAHALAYQAATATAMARTLLLSLFDTETLLSSNLKGGASKRPGTDESVRFSRLDSRKLEAIYSMY